MKSKTSTQLDPFKDLDKRARLALRQALQSGSDGGVAPSEVVKKLERKHLVRRTGHLVVIPTHSPRSRSLVRSICTVESPHDDRLR